MMTRKKVSTLSYLTAIGWLLAYRCYKKGARTSLAKYHLEQSLGMGIIVFVMNLLLVPLVLINTVFAPILFFSNLGLVILWMIGLISAYHGVRLPLPFIGFYFRDKFRFIP
ncbi:DUF4870 domain-containing protein [Flavobacterium sp. CYK-4]|uniref:DUF4870 domain-containing protein n=1 Tax=Flavobacterium lotistagni TaxID=2709660 RepID=UPI00140A7C57|nr:DUF4870 domain-containing protein [Flavobacterium lotistagni]NHM07116.1 DUF4870 domain-containing protein [Flavobacterium lotistagni]